MIGVLFSKLALALVNGAVAKVADVHLAVQEESVKGVLIERWGGGAVYYFFRFRLAIG